MRMLIDCRTYFPPAEEDSSITEQDTVEVTDKDASISVEDDSITPKLDTTESLVTDSSILAKEDTATIKEDVSQAAESEETPPVGLLGNSLGIKNEDKKVDAIQSSHSEQQIS